MRPRIRTVKPEFFLNEKLFDLEKETGLPIRIAFEGLWCWADREGRFEWRARTLKAGILPFDDVDFSRVLDALESRGFIIKYACGEGHKREEYGWIPTLKEHQAFNNKEKLSELPSPEDCEIISDGYTREVRVNLAFQTPLEKDRVERNGMGTGTEPLEARVRTSTRPTPSDRMAAHFEAGKRALKRSDLEALFSETKRANKRGSYRLKHTDDELADAAIAWALDDHPDDPGGACLHSIANFFAHCATDEGSRRFNAWEFSAWAKDPGKWFAHVQTNGRRNGPGEVSTEFDESQNPEWARGPA